MNDRQQVKSWVEASSNEGWLAKLAQWYERDWQNAIDSVAKGQQQLPPDASEIIGLLPEQKRELARSTVRSIDEYYRETYQSKSSHRSRGRDHSHLTDAVYVGALGSEHATLDGNSQSLSVDELQAEPESRLTNAFDQATLDSDMVLGETPVGIDQPTMDSADVAETPSVRVGGAGRVEPFDLEATGEFSVGDVAKNPTVRRGRRTMGQTAGDTSETQTINFRVGDLVGDYRIERVLGRGGMGIVFLARQMKLDRLVALKMILSGGDGVLDSQLARFEAEAKAIAKFQHENIVRIFETGNHDGMPYFSLEYIEGESLTELMHDGPLEYKEAARLGAEIGRGVHYAHTRGIVHRDLKPANVLLTLDDQAKVTDFGLAKEFESDQSLSMDGSVVGTPGFMAPEQVTQSHEIGPPADVWGLGSVLYAMLTGQPPFLGANRGESMMMLIQEEPPIPSRVRPGIPIDLETICLKCLEKDPARRYLSAEEVADDLDRFLKREPISARAITRTERAWRWCKRNPKIALPSAAAACLGLVFAVGGPVVAGTIYQQKQEVENQKKLVDQTNEELVVSQKIAVDSQDAAEKGLKGATDAMQVVVFKVMKNLKDRPGMSGVRNELLQTVRTQLGLTDDYIDPELQSNLTIARVLITMGEMNTEAGRFVAAKKNYEKCLQVIQNLDEQSELSKNNRLHNLSKAENSVGRAALKLADLKTAKKHFENALELRRQWISDQPDRAGVRESVADTLGALGTAEKYLGEFDSAREHLDESLALRQESLDQSPNDLKRALDWIGSKRALVLLGAQQNGGDDAIGEMQKVLLEFEELVPREVAGLVVRANTALAANQLGTMQLSAEQYESASKSFQRGVVLFSEVLGEEPSRNDLREHLGDSIEGILLSETAQGRELDDESLQEFVRRLKDVRSSLVQLDPYDSRRRLAAIDSYIRLREYQNALELAGRITDPKTADDELWLASAGSLAMISTIPEDAFTKFRASLSDDQADAKEWTPVIFRERAIAVLRTALRLEVVTLDAIQDDREVTVLSDDPEFMDLLANAGGLATH